MSLRPLAPALALLACLPCSGCDSKREPPAAAAPALTVASMASSPASATAPRPTSAPARPSAEPARQAGLTDAQLARIKALHAAIAEVDDTPLDKWVDDFKRDGNPEHELAVYEAIASGYTGYTKGRTLKKDAKIEVYKLLVFRSTASEKEVLDQAPIEALTKAQAVEVLKGYKPPPEAGAVSP